MTIPRTRKLCGWSPVSCRYSLCQWVTGGSCVVVNQCSVLRLLLLLSIVVVTSSAIRSEDVTRSPLTSCEFNNCTCSKHKQADILRTISTKQLACVVLFYNNFRSWENCRFITSILNVLSWRSFASAGNLTRNLFAGPLIPHYLTPLIPVTTPHHKLWKRPVCKVDLYLVCFRP